jgi:hypothetical protein
MWRDAHDNFKIDQRAWIGLEDIVSTPLVPEIGKPWDLAPSLKNSGKTPGKRVMMRNVEELSSDTPDVNIRCAEAVAMKASQTILPPNSSYKAVLHVANGVSLPKDWQKEITDHGTLYVDGCIVYDDIFGDTHWMTYCARFTPVIESNPVSFLACPLYNDSGEGNQPKK